MPNGPASTADEITDSIRSLIDRMVDSKFAQEMAKRGQDVAGLLAERGAEAGVLANDAWRDSRSTRRDAAKRLAQATDQAARTWRKSLRPMLKDMWKERAVAIGAAGAAVPVGRELVDSAAVRLGIKERRAEARHWGAFFLGLLLGAAGGAIAAMLTTPKRGVEMRRELGARADEIAAKAKEEWVPIFQRDEVTNGHVAETLPGESLTGAEFGESTAAIQEGAADAGDATDEASMASGEAAEAAADDTAEAINESFDTVDRESKA